jgi:hypothetical protein
LKLEIAYNTEDPEGMEEKIVETEKRFTADSSIESW